MPTFALHQRPLFVLETYMESTWRYRVFVHSLEDAFSVKGIDATGFQKMHNF